MRQACCFLVLLVLFGSCSDTPPDSCEDNPLKDHATYAIGGAFNIWDYYGSASLGVTFHRHFNSLTIENALKMGHLVPSPGNYLWEEPDTLISIMEGRGRVHGHTLIWHQQQPSWLENYDDDFQELLTDHIKTVVGRYRNDILSWDVINEGLNEDGTLRNTIWLENVGPQYFYHAFKAAQEANPSAELFYNDFNLAINPKKLDAAIRLCQKLEDQGIDVAGIGFQMHVALGFPRKRDLADAVEKVWKAGFKVHFSELDVSVNIIGNKEAISQEDLEDQREKYHEIISVYEQIPSEYQFGITMWGVGDADSWLPSHFNRIDAGLLFDGTYQPKPAFCGFKEALE